MAIQITFTTDEEFTEHHIKCMLQYEEMQDALSNILMYLSRLERGKIDIPEEMTKDELVEKICNFAREEASGIHFLP